MPKCRECGDPFERVAKYWQRYCSDNCRNTHKCRAYRHAHPEKIREAKRLRRSKPAPSQRG